MNRPIAFKFIQKPLNKIKLKKYLRNILIIFCLIGFVGQTIQLLEVYFSGDTVPVIRVERLKQSKFPAITVCLPIFLSFKNFAQTFPQYEKTYTDYMDLVGAKNWNDQVKGQFKQIFQNL